MLDLILLDLEIFGKRILELSCGQRVLVLKILSDIYL